jgi:hypothetical protein
MQTERTSWHCQHLEVLCTSTGESWLFPCNAWLSSSSSSSSRIAAAAAGAGAGSAGPQLVLYPAANLDAMWRQLQLEEQQQQQQQEDLTVTVYTANVPGAGADTIAMSRRPACILCVPGIIQH